MPLPIEVGAALADYLSDAPSTNRAAARYSFHAKAPRRAIRADLVSDATRRACDRAGLPRGAHRLRHTLATEMLQRGVKLADISQVLRHRDGHHRALRQS